MLYNYTDSDHSLLSQQTYFVLHFGFLLRDRAIKPHAEAVDSFDSKMSVQRPRTGCSYELLSN